MYASFENEREITLWCDGKKNSELSKRKKRSQSAESDDEGPTTKRAKKEAKINELVQTLSAEHGNKLSQPLYKLWAQMVVTGQWSSLEHPPNIPLFTGASAHTVSRKKDKGNTAEVLADAAIHLLDHFRQSESTSSSSQPHSTPERLHNTSQDQLASLSPGKKVSIRSQYFGQLRDLQKLREDGTLSADEFAEEKGRILETLRAMK